MAGAGDVMSSMRLRKFETDRDLVLMIGILIAVVRVAVVYDPGPLTGIWFEIYKDTAHFFIAGLITSWWYARYKYQWYLFWMLNVVEVACAIWSHV